MDHQARVKQIIDNAKKQFEVNGVGWNDRVEAAIRNLITPFMADIEHLTMPPVVAQVVRSTLDMAHDWDTEDPEDGLMITKAENWIHARYDSEGQLID